MTCIVAEKRKNTLQFATTTKFSCPAATAWHRVVWSPLEDISWGVEVNARWKRNKYFTERLQIAAIKTEPRWALVLALALTAASNWHRLWKNTPTSIFINKMYGPDGRHDMRSTHLKHHFLIFRFYELTSPFHLLTLYRAILLYNVIWERVSKMVFFALYSMWTAPFKLQPEETRQFWENYYAPTCLTRFQMSPKIKLLYPVQIFTPLKNPWTFIQNF